VRGTIKGRGNIVLIGYPRVGKTVLAKKHLGQDRMHECKLQKTFMHSNTLDK